MITPEVREEIRSRVDIIALIGEVVSLKKRGGSWVGLCPFHGEKTPSFHVKGARFYCFGCQTSGDAFAFVRESQGLSWPEAVRWLADRVGYELPDRSPEETAAYRIERQRLDDAYALNEFAARWFRERIEGPCREYLNQRGVTVETGARYGLGYALDAYDALAKALTEAGADLVLAIEVGLLGQGRKDPTRLYDTFRHRLMFPIRDAQGRCIGFSGRILPGGRTNRPDAGKYVNSRESSVYVKGQALYGLLEALPTIRKTHVGLVVEGNLDVVLAHQAGLTNVVCPLGTAFGLEQMRLLRRHAPDGATIAFDGDAAGLKATKAAVAMGLGEGYSLSVVRCPEGQDPGSIVAQDAEAFVELVSDPSPAWEWLVTTSVTENRAGESVSGVEAVVLELAPIIASVTPASRSLYVRSAAKILGLEAHELDRLLRSKEPRAKGVTFVDVAPVEPLPEPMTRILALLTESETFKAVFQGRDLAQGLPDKLREMAEATAEHGLDGVPASHRTAVARVAFSLEAVDAMAEIEAMMLPLKRLALANKATQATTPTGLAALFAAAREIDTLMTKAMQHG